MLLILLLAGLAIVPGLADADGGGLADTPWPMFQHDTRHTGCSPYVGPQTANLKWTFTLDKNWGYIYTMSPAIAGDGTLYVGGYNGSNLLHAVNTENGTEKWPLWAGDMDYTPAIGSDGTIYLNQYSASNYNRLVAYRPDGTSKYIYNIGSAHGMTCSPAIGPDGTLYFTTDSGNILYAVRDNGSSFDEIWTYTAADPFKWQSPALATSGPNSGIIYISAGNHLYAIYSSTGLQKWDLDLVSAGTYTTPAIGADGTIYINDGHGSLVAITDTGSAGGVRKWDYNIAGSSLASPAIGPDGTIYIGNNNGPIHGDSIFWAINDNVTYATRRWQRDGLGAADASAVIGADSTVYYQTRTGWFYALDGANGTTKWSYPLNAGGLSAAAIDAGGCVYVGSWNSTLYCFAPPAPTVASISPAQGNLGQTLTVVVTGSNFFGSPTVSFSGTGITVNSITVNSLTQLTASITVGDNCTPGLRDVTVSTGGDTATLTGGFHVLTPPAPTVASISPAQGNLGQTLTVVVTGSNFFGSPTVSFSGTGITVNSVTVDNLTQLTASITIAGGCAPGFRDITVETWGGTGTKISGFTVNALPPPPPTPGPQLIGTGAGSTGGSSGSMSSSISTTQPVVNATIIIQSASISRSQTSGEPVTISATVSNTSTVNGITKVRLYVNGQLDSEQAVSVASGKQIPVNFNVSRNEPGTYQVYVNGTSAGSFTVSHDSTILYISIACLFLAFVLGVILIYRRFTV